jgi:glycosyltransferase involved in cell wall biosynthesis
VARSWVRSQLDKLKEWDRSTSSRVTQFIANGKTVQQRIKEAYGRESVIIHPPVNVDFYVPDVLVKREDYYLVVSALAPNKRTDLAIGACQKLGRPLVVIGTGEEERRLRQLAGSETTFLGWASKETIRQHLQRCRALLFPGEEDFGIVPVEAQACGTAVIAYGVGGATETVVPLGAAKPTGVWFTEPSKESLAAAMQRYEIEGSAIKPETCRANAEQYGADRFRTSMEQAITSCLR